MVEKVSLFTVEKGDEQYPDIWSVMDLLENVCLKKGIGLDLMLSAIINMIVILGENWDDETFEKLIELIRKTRRKQQEDIKSGENQVEKNKDG